MARELRADRDWDGGETGVEVATAGADSERSVTAVAFPVLGRSEPIGRV